MNKWIDCIISNTPCVLKNTPIGISFTLMFFGKFFKAFEIVLEVYLFDR